MAVRPTFSKAITDAEKGMVLSPILHSYLYNAKYPKNFSVKFTNHSSHRAPDGYFHPSTHPLWNERQLYYYITEPGKMVDEPMEYMGALSTTMGTAIHGFIQMCLKDAKVLVSSEVPVVDEVHKSRGSMDGLLSIPHYGEAGFEFKTSNMMKLSNAQDMDIAGFKKKWPTYYAQVQEYMRLSGLRRFIVLFMGMGYPWTLKEFHIPYDVPAATDVERKYRRVLDMAAQGILPSSCCLGGKEAEACPARRICPVASR
jgi:hypothetical protein